jgi:hypothetical protein
MEHRFEPSVDTSLPGDASLTACGWLWCLVLRYSFNALKAAEEPRLGTTMTDRNRSFSVALGIVVVLIAVVVLAAMLAP